jgi:hypothetical protein
MPDPTAALSAVTPPVGGLSMSVPPLVAKPSTNPDILLSGLESQMADIGQRREKIRNEWEPKIHQVEESYSKALNAPTPEMEPFKPLVSPPKYSGMAMIPDQMAIFALIAGLGAMSTRQPLLNAMNAMGSAIKGFHDGDIESFKRHRDLWRDETDFAIEQNKEIARKAEAINKSSQKTLEQKKAELEMLFKQYGFQEKELDNQAKSIESMYNIMARHQDHTDTLELRRDQINQHAEFMQANLEEKQRANQASEEIKQLRVELANRVAASTDLHKTRAEELKEHADAWREDVAKGQLGVRQQHENMWESLGLKSAAQKDVALGQGQQRIDQAGQRITQAGEKLAFEEEYKIGEAFRAQEKIDNQADQFTRRLALNSSQFGQKLALATKKEDYNELHQDQVFNFKQGVQAFNEIVKGRQLNLQERNVLREEDWETFKKWMETQKGELSQQWQYFKEQAMTRGLTDREAHTLFMEAHIKNTDAAREDQNRYNRWYQTRRLDQTDRAMAEKSREFDQTKQQREEGLRLKERALDIRGIRQEYKEKKESLYPTPPKGYRFKYNESGEPVTDPTTGKQALEKLGADGGQYERIYRTRLVTNAMDAANRLNTIWNSPFTTTGVLGQGEKTHGGLFSPGVEKYLSNKINQESALRLQDLQNGLYRTIAVVEAGGGAKGVTETSIRELRRDAIEPGEPVGSAQLKIASLAQYTRNSLLGQDLSRFTDPNQKAQIEKAIELINKIPEPDELQKRFYEGTYAPSLGGAPFSTVTGAKATLKTNAQGNYDDPEMERQYQEYLKSRSR